MSKHLQVILACVILSLSSIIAVYAVFSLNLSESLSVLGKWQAYVRHDRHNNVILYENPQLVSETCSLSLAESIPIGLTFNSSIEHESTYSAWKRLLTGVSSLRLASYYWTMRGVDVVEDPTAGEGEDIFNRLLQLSADRSKQLRIVQSWPNSESSNDTSLLAGSGGTEVRSLNFPRLLAGSGILHTKMWLADKSHFYLGSANMDYRALTQVKELGVLGWGCDSLTADLEKIFDVYWMLSESNSTVIPSEWPQHLHTTINATNQLPLRLVSGHTVSVYVASSPPPLCPPGRTDDLTAIVHTIRDARQFVYVAVMDYLPMVITYNDDNGSGGGSRRVAADSAYWPVIDDALRSVAVDSSVHVRLLASVWRHSRPEMMYTLRSLAALNGMWSRVRVEVRLFRVPPVSGTASRIPFTRVNHNKYMVTDRAMYVGTSNWSGDYFIDTGGVGLVVNETIPDKNHDPANPSPRDQLESLFLRDWDSEHALPLSDFETIV